jgi:hypothetical protein
MPQFLRPSSDISAGAWTTTPLFSKINEESSNDSPLITSPNGSNTTCDLGLSTASTPQSGARTIRIRVRKGTQTNNRGLNFNLKQGGSSVQSGTVEATLPTTFTTYSITVTGTITDYSDLSIELISTGTVTGAGTARAVVDVSWVEFEIPDQEVTNPNISGDILLPSITSTATIENDSVIEGSYLEFFHAMHPLVNPRMQKLIAAQNFENGEVVGKAYYTFTHGKFYKFYFGSEPIESDYSWEIITGGDAFAISTGGQITISNISNFTATTTITVRCTFKGEYFEDQDIQIIYVPTADAIYLDFTNDGTATGSRTQPYKRARSITAAARLGKTLFYKSGTTTLDEYLGTFENEETDPFTNFARWGTGARPIIDASDNLVANRFMDFGHRTDFSRIGYNVRVIEIEFFHDCSTDNYPFQIKPYSRNFEMYNCKFTGTTFANGFIWCSGISSSLGAEAIPYDIDNPDRIFCNIECYDFREQTSIIPEGDGCRAIKLECGGNFAENLKATTTFTNQLSAPISAVDMPGTYIRFAYMDTSAGINTRGPNIRTAFQTYKNCYVIGPWESIAISNNDYGGWRNNGFEVDGTSGFEHCILEGGTTSGIAFFNTENTSEDPPATTVKLRGIITDGCAAGVRFNNGVRNVDVTSSIFLRSTANGVRQTTASGNRIINCLSLDSVGDDVLISSGSIDAINSIFETETGTVNETTCSTNVSSFVDFAADDFRLAEGSPLIGAGTFVASGTKDVIGVNYLNPPSIGAFEYVEYAESDDVNISGEIIIPNITSEAVIEHQVPEYSITGSVSIPSITSEAVLSFGEPVFDISGEIIIPNITSEAILESEVPVYEIEGGILIPAITSESTLSFGEPVFSISGDILTPAITSEAILEHEIPIYEITGDIFTPAITSEAVISFGVPSFNISGDIFTPVITSSATIEHEVPEYSINGDILIQAITSEAVLSFGEPVYGIEGDFVISVITSDAVITFAVPVYQIEGDIIIPNITSDAVISFGSPVYGIEGDIFTPSITSSAALESNPPIFDINGEINIPTLTSDGIIIFGDSFFAITGEILIPQITSSGVLDNDSISIDYNINGNISIPAISSTAFISATFDECTMEVSHLLRLAIIQTINPLVVEGVTIPIFDERVNPAATIPELLNGISYVLIRSQEEFETTNDKCAFRQNALITLDCVVKYPVNVGSKLASELISCEIQSRINRQVPIPGWQVLVVRRVNATSIVEQGITQTAYRKLITFQFDVYKR